MALRDLNRDLSCRDLRHATERSDRRLCGGCCRVSRSSGCRDSCDHSAGVRSVVRGGVHSADHASPNDRLDGKLSNRQYG